MGLEAHFRELCCPRLDERLDDGPALEHRRAAPAGGDREPLDASPDHSAVLSHTRERPGALALGPPTPGDRFAAAAATISLLAAGAEDALVLAVVDDTQWLDTPSREALLFAGRRLRGEGVVLLLAMRDRLYQQEIIVDRQGLGNLNEEGPHVLVTIALAGRVLLGVLARIHRGSR